MAPRGRKPKPASVRKIEGNRGKRRIPVTPEPRAASGPELEPPTWLDTPAKATWRELVPELQLNGVLAFVDRGALAVSCQAYSDIVDARRKLKKKFSWAQMQRWQHAVKTFKAFATEFGLTPSSRMRLHLAEPDNADDSDLDPV